jgi:membrane-anchored protein YejM (alkaline phosphatase superfamily)
MLAELSEGLRTMYRSKFPLIYAAKPTDGRALALNDHRPNVIIIALESFRRDGMSSEWMPKVDAWSRGGLRLRRHYTGSIFSEAGLFALLYGRSPLVYHSVLDAGVRPQLCETLRHSGYRCGYFSGHPKVWFRREEYINDRTFDEFVHDDTGDWNQWDRTALKNLVRAARATGKKPLFGMVFLMSSHFEYQYPPEYERHLPVTRDLTWETTRMSVLGPESREPLLNRYRNTLAFLDDALDQTIRALDPKQNLIIITADHGESFNDDGRFGHGSVFSDVVARVPMAIVGPGIEPAEFDEPTLHVDVLPTVVHALAGHSVSIAHAHGRDLLARQPARESLLLAHCDPNRDSAEALLLRGDRRVRLHLGLQAPTLQLLGLEDDRARLVVDHHLDSTQVQQLLAAFEGQLATLIR